MRDYRGLRKDNGEMIYGWKFPYPTDGTVYIIPNRAKIHRLRSNNFRPTLIDMVEVIPETVGQQVGLKDKNGVEIFEGDKFKVIYSDTPNGFSPLGRDKTIIEIYGVVVYKESGFYIKHKDPISKEVRYGSLVSFLKNPKEITGNIHQPKPLNKKVKE